MNLISNKIKCLCLATSMAMSISLFAADQGEAEAPAAAMSFGQQLLEAAWSKDLGTLVEIIKKHPEVLNYVDEDGNTALIIASATNQIHAVKELLDAGADPVLLSNTKRNSLIMAAANGDAEAIKLILRHSKRHNFINEHGVDGMTALHYAIITNHTEAVEVLLSEGADPNLDSGGHRLPLTLAAYKGSVGSIVALLKRGAIFDAHKPFPALALAKEKKQAEAVKALEDYRDSLFKPIVKGKVEAVIRFVRQGTANINMLNKDEDGRTALSVAMDINKNDIAMVLLCSGAVLKPGNPNPNSLPKELASSAAIDVFKLYAKNKDELDKEQDLKTRIDLALKLLGKAEEELTEKLASKIVPKRKKTKSGKGGPTKQQALEAAGGGGSWPSPPSSTSVSRCASAVAGTPSDEIGMLALQTPTAGTPDDPATWGLVEPKDRGVAGGRPLFAFEIIATRVLNWWENPAQALKDADTKHHYGSKNADKTPEELREVIYKHAFANNFTIEGLLQGNRDLANVDRNVFNKKTGNYDSIRHTLSATIVDLQKPFAMDACKTATINFTVDRDGGYYHRGICFKPNADLHRLFNRKAWHLLSVTDPKSASTPAPADGSAYIITENADYYEVRDPEHDIVIFIFKSI